MIMFAPQPNPHRKPVIPELSLRLPHGRENFQHFILTHGHCFWFWQHTFIHTRRSLHQDCINAVRMFRQ